jgi:hypothetical protein
MERRFLFAELDTRLSNLPESKLLAVNRSPLEKWAARILAVATVVALPSLWLLPAKIGPFVSLAALAVQLGCLSIGLYYLIRYDIPDLRNASKSWSAILDHDAPHFLSIVTWVRTFPRDKIVTSRRYLKHRSDLYLTKQSWIIGPTDRLGLLPVMLAIWLQFKDFRFEWPPTANWLSYALSVGIVTLYLATQMMSKAHFRGLVYLAVLDEALEGVETWASNRTAASEPVA